MFNHIKISAIIDMIKRNGYKVCRAAGLKRKKIIYRSRKDFLIGIWKRDFRAYHYEPDSCPNSPYWMTLNHFPVHLDGRFILFDEETPYAIYENMGRRIELSRKEIKY